MSAHQDGPKSYGGHGVTDNTDNKTLWLLGGVMALGFAGYVALEVFKSDIIETSRSALGTSAPSANTTGVR
jgi:hypothetical protein